MVSIFIFLPNVDKKPKRNTQKQFLSWDFFPSVTRLPGAPSSSPHHAPPPWLPCPLLGRACDPQTHPATTAEALVGTNTLLSTHKLSPNVRGIKRATSISLTQRQRKNNSRQGHACLAARAPLSGPAQLPNRDVPDSNCNQFVTTVISPTVTPRGKHVKTNTCIQRARQKAEAGHL